MRRAKSKSLQERVTSLDIIDRLRRWGTLILRELDLLPSPGGPVFSPRMAQLYLAASPRLYFKTIEYLVMFISFYMSLWMCNFLHAADIFPYPDNITWKIYSLLPGIASLAMYAYVIRAASFLLATTLKDVDAIDEVEEHVRDVRLLREDLRETILHNLFLEREEYAGDVKEYLKRLEMAEARGIVEGMFREINPDKCARLR